MHIYIYFSKNINIIIIIDFFRSISISRLREKGNKMPNEIRRGQRNKKFWLCISGTTTHASDMNVTKKKKKDINGQYLNGLMRDMVMVDEHLERFGYILFNRICNMRDTTKHTVLSSIRRYCFFIRRRQNAKKCAYIYYTGHGGTNNGNWCFKDGYISLNEILAIIAHEFRIKRVVLYCDCCYAANWVMDIAKQDTRFFEYVKISASGWPGTSAYDTKDGGLFTLHKFGKKNNNVKWIMYDTLFENPLYYRGHELIYDGTSDTDDDNSSEELSD